MYFLSIFLPIVALAAGIVTYLQYRKTAEQRVLETGPGGGADELRAGGETVYQGLLWLKDKYEQDREQATAKYMELKEDYERLREDYQKLETGHAYTQDLLNERQSTIDRLREQLQQEALRTAEAKGKLESSGHLLLQMHKELDLALVGDTGRPPRKDVVQTQETAQTGDAVPEGKTGSAETLDAVPGGGIESAETQLAETGEAESKEPLVVAAQ
jgi:hypothetical protein